MLHMQKLLNTTIRERIAAAMLALLGAGSFVAAGMESRANQLRIDQALLAAALSAAIIVADQFPIHILRGTKVSLINVPILLSVVLIPAPLAIASTGAGLLIANLRGRKERGLLPRDIIGTLGQWMFSVYLATRMAQLIPSTGNPELVHYAVLFTCVLTLLLSDFFIFAISQASIFSEPFIPVFKSVMREGLALELSQYCVAALGAIVASQSIWFLPLLIVPVVIMYTAFKNLKETRFETIQILEDMADTVDLRDIYTGGHSRRVAEVVRGMLEQMNISGPEATLTQIAARLHDIGKIGIADSILQKPEKLLPEEMQVMHTHSTKGAELIAKYKDFARGAAMILYHHERWDGLGYPAGLKGSEIPFGARLIAVADAFDAMTSDRPYRKALSTGQAIQTLLDGRGSQWDPKIVMALLGYLAQESVQETNRLVLATGRESLRTGA